MIGFLADRAFCGAILRKKGTFKFVMFRCHAFRAVFFCVGIIIRGQLVPFFIFG